MGRTPFHKETDWRFGRYSPESVSYNFIVVGAFSNVKGEYGGKMPCLPLAKGGGLWYSNNNFITIALD